MVWPLIAFGILSARGAALYAASPATSVRTKDFLGGEVATLVITIATAAGLILIANTLVQGLWKTTSITSALFGLAVVVLAVLAWMGLGRMNRRQEGEKHPGTATLLTMPEIRPTPTATPSTGRSTGRQSRKRAA